MAGRAAADGRSSAVTLSDLVPGKFAEHVGQGALQLVEFRDAVPGPDGDQNIAGSARRDVVERGAKATSHAVARDVTETSHAHREGDARGTAGDECTHRQRSRADGAS